MTWGIFSAQEFFYLLRIILAAACGGAIGFERERRLKSAGIRTHLIVGLSAALMMVVSKYGFFDVVNADGSITVDASRVAAGVVTAIGFLGAGVIFFRREAVSGVTTAAGLWATVGVGVAVGAGLYTVGILATVFIIVMQLLLHRRSPLVKPQKAGTVVLLLDRAESGRAEAYYHLEKVAQQVESIELRRVEGGKVEIRCEVLFPGDFTAADLLQALREQPEIQAVEMHQP